MSDQTGRLPTTPPSRHRRALVAVEQPSWVRRHALHLGTAGLGLVAIALGWVYSNPALTRPVPRPGARVYSLVQQIDAAGPVWFTMFVVVGVALVASVFVERWADLAHGVAAGAHGMFSAAVWIGWALSDPRPPAVSGFLTLGFVIVHPVFALIYSNRRT